MEQVGADETMRDISVPDQLRNLYDDPLLELVSVRPDSDGVLLCDSTVRLDGRPSIEIPHKDPHLVSGDDGSPIEEPPITFEELIANYDCEIQSRFDCTYVVAAEA